MDRKTLIRRILTVAAFCFGVAAVVLLGFCFFGNNEGNTVLNLTLLATFMMNLAIFIRNKYFKEDSGE